MSLSDYFYHAGLGHQAVPKCSGFKQFMYLSHGFVGPEGSTGQFSPVVEVVFSETAAGAGWGWSPRWQLRAPPCGLSLPQDGLHLSRGDLGFGEQVGTPALSQLGASLVQHLSHQVPLLRVVTRPPGCRVGRNGLCLDGVVVRRGQEQRPATLRGKLPRTRDSPRSLGS